MCPKSLPLHRIQIRKISLSHRERSNRMFGSTLLKDNAPGSNLRLLAPTRDEPVYL